MHQLRVASRSVRRSCSCSCTSRSTLPSSQVSKITLIFNHCFAAGSVKSSPSSDQSVAQSIACCFLLALVASFAHCLLCFCSHHGPFIVRIAQLSHHVMVSFSFLHPPRRSQPMQEIVCFHFCLFFLSFSSSSPTSAQFR